ncbi:unnamed protein product [Eruca vesicaria subsp. sativa]|uniref:COP9 signalosome complex subunit 3 N-terminal helical repeats domain-containing protein n=1 Tax=Eruca vesicaria subsp. sativa TaxID=29727 RepID=A0ABC8K4L0_ERUVS|nr:unnamed protein product [Eruca vesicaria subsp. sativa]
MEGVIKSIQGLSTSPGDLSSLHRLLKGAEETLRSESDLQICTLDQLDASKHSLGYLYLLDVLTCGPMSKEQVLLIARFINSCDAEQIRLASDKCNHSLFFHTPPSQGARVCLF